MDSMNTIQFLEAVAKLSMIIMIGLYFVFSNTVMKALKQSQDGADVMVGINEVILNPLFMSIFVISGISSGYFIFADSMPVRFSGLLFFAGTTLVTLIKNVPLNNKLRDAEQLAEREVVWQEYLNRWVFWNHVRSISGVIAGFFLVL